MIDVSKLTKIDRGRRVIYTDAFGHKDSGKLVGWEDGWAMVDFWQDGTKKPVHTNPGELDFAQEGE